MKKILNSETSINVNNRECEAKLKNLNGDYHSSNIAFTKGEPKHRLTPIFDNAKAYSQVRGKTRT